MLPARPRLLNTDRTLLSDLRCRAVLARAETIADRAIGDEAHATLAEISDRIAAALASATW